jgi:hypothetical protein
VVALGRVVAKDLTATDGSNSIKDKDNVSDNVSIDKRLHKKRKTRNIETHPNTNKESFDKHRFDW